MVLILFLSEAMPTLTPIASIKIFKNNSFSFPNYLAEI